ncbi:BnaA03g53780D [Brassica napus]|uniref:BnaA03g53780D protein n=2 Tax=Brassica TaxID=3705 RepID=A0A078HW69_BRANA|nr:BnaA03g53780D [Brassica napus]VDC84331.1 unnamed protein product [Brassica rapa]
MNQFLLLYLHVSIFTLLINNGSRWAAFRNILAEILEASGLMVPNQKPSDAEEHLVGVSDDVGVGFIHDHGNQPSSSTFDRATDSTGQDETGVSKVIRSDQKRFFFDLGNNNRGHFLRISEVLNELELVSKTLQVEQKLFYLDLKENPRGKYLKISEKTSGSRSTIIVPSSGISWFLDLFNYYLPNGGEDELLPLKSLLARSVFQIRVTLYNFTPNHHTFSVSTITEDLIIDNQADVCNLAGESLVFPAFIYTSLSEAAENILPSSEGARGLTASSSDVAVVGKKV